MYYNIALYSGNKRHVLLKIFNPFTLNLPKLNFKSTKQKNVINCIDFGVSKQTAGECVFNID